jgi:hypothetical protein
MLSAADCARALLQRCHKRKCRLESLVRKILDLFEGEDEKIHESENLKPSKITRVSLERSDFACSWLKNNDNHDNDNDNNDDNDDLGKNKLAKRPIHKSEK